MRVAKKMIVSGKVQGVGFRYFSQATAAEHDINGWVRNLSDGTVELHVEGEEGKYNSFKQSLRDGNRFVGVEQIEEKDVPTENYKAFEIRY